MDIDLDLVPQREKFLRSWFVTHDAVGSWQDRTEPESMFYYMRLADGNYHRLPGNKDGLPDGIPGIKIQSMIRATQIIEREFPNRILVSDVLHMHLGTGILNEDVRREAMRDNLAAELSVAGNTRIYDTGNSATITIEEIEEELRDHSDDLHSHSEEYSVVDAWKAKGTERRIKRLESENAYYKKEYQKYQQRYIEAGHKVNILKAEVERLKQLVPVTINPDSVKDKTDLTRRFATMDLM